MRAPTPAKATRRARIADTLRTLGARWSGRAASLSPAGLLFGAVFQKEMRVAGRKTSTYLVRSIYAALLVGLALLVFWASRAGTRGQTGAAALQRLQEIAPAVTTSVLWFQMIFLPLVAAMLTAPSICDEVRARSLPALLTTPLTAAQIVLSKLSGCMASVSILALVSVPLLLGLRIFGGVDSEVVLAGSAITLSATVLAGSMGMLVSVFARRSSMAGSGAIAGVVGLILIPLPVIFLLMARGFLAQTTAIELAGGACPPAALMMVLLIASGEPGPPGVEITALWTSNTVYNLVASAILLTFATLAFRARLTGDRGEQVLGAADRAGLLNRPKKARKPRQTAKGKADAPTTILPGAPATGDRLEATVATPESAGTESFAPLASRTVGDHPVLWRELRRQGSRAASRRKGLTSATISMVILSILGLFLPLYGLWEASRNGSPSSFAGLSTPGSSPLLVATGGLVLLVAFLVVLTAFRALKRVGLGGAIVVPARPLCLCCQSIGVLVFAYWMSEGEFEPIHYLVAGAGQGLVLLRAATQNAGTLAEEREARTWETLLTTRLTPREILLGKLAGALARQWDVPLLILLHFAFAGVLIDHLSPLILLHLAATMIAGVVFLSGTGMALALLAPKGSIASLANTCLALILWLVLPIGVGLTAQSLGFQTHDSALGAFLLGSNPVALGMFGLAGAIDGVNYSTGDAYSIAGLSLSTPVFTTVLLGVSALYLALGVAAYQWACAAFNRRTGRTS